ncbi:MAG: hypothetical protein IPJ76_15495 [Flavobacteriales bacterium]|nr:MAG: hypothetical protein IPJ76_15495 [Flavobacteriales bacterium]
MSTNGTTRSKRMTLRWLLVLSALFLADVLLARVGWHKLADACFWAGLVGAIVLVLRSTQNRLRSFLTVPVDARFLPATRVAYAILCLYTAAQHLWAVDLGMEPSNFPMLGIPESKPLAYALNAVYMGALVTLMLGKWIRASWVILFAVGGLLMPHSLELFIKQPLNFFAMFVSPALWRGDRSAETPSAGWPLLLSAMAIAFITAGAGVFKLFDPVWLHGTGFYYSLNIPFFCPKHLRPLLDNWPLVLFCNWATIVVEIIAFPLLLWRRTRAFALLCVVGLGVFLAWPMWGIGLVGGPMVLAFVPAWSGICPPLARWWLKWRKKPLDGTATLQPAITDQHLPGYAVLIAWWTILGFVGTSLSKYDRFKTWPPLYGYQQFEVHARPVRIPTHVEDRIADTYEGLALLRPYKLWEWVWLLELFDYHHLFERAAFQARVVHVDGTEQLVSMFDEDRALNSDIAWFGYIHFLKNVDAIRSLRHRDRLKPHVVAYHQAVMDDIARYAMVQAAPGTAVREVVIDVHPLHQPLKFEGDSKPWLTVTHYEPFYLYDPATATGKVIGAVKPYPFHLLDVPAFRDRVIVPVPDAPVSTASSAR